MLPVVADEIMHSSETSLVGRDSLHSECSPFPLVELHPWDYGKYRRDLLNNSLLSLAVSKMFDKDNDQHG